MQNSTPFRYWELMGNHQYVKQIQEIQKLGGDGRNKNEKPEGRRVTGIRMKIGGLKSNHGNVVSGSEEEFQRAAPGFGLESVDETFVGSMILEEKPLVILPQIPSEGEYLVCIGCCRPISWEEKLAECRNCSWPVCYDGCEGEVSLHTEAECKILAPVSDSSHWLKRGGYESLWMIRIVCLKSLERDAYDRIMKIGVDEDSLDQEDVVPHRYFAVQTLRRMYDIQPDTASDEELNHVWNVLRLKCFNSLSSVSAQFKRAKVLYEEMGKFPHSCHPNASYEMDSDFTVRICLQSSIEAGESITVNYDPESLFQPNRSRQARLRKLVKIQCSCGRCEDPTEFGTFFGGIPCHSTKACRVAKSPGYLLQMNATDAQSSWECFQCHIVPVSNLEVQSWLYSIQQGLESICSKQEPYQLCIFVDKLVEQHVLHEYHHLVFDYYVETLKLFYGQLTNDPEMRNIDELLKYKRAAKCVCKIMRSFLPVHTDVIGPLPFISTLVKMAGLIESFKNETVQIARVVQDLDRYVAKTEEDGSVVLRMGPLAVLHETRLKSFLNDVMTALVLQLKNYISVFSEKSSDSQSIVEDLKGYVDVIQANFSFAAVGHIAGAFSTDTSDLREVMQNISVLNEANPEVIEAFKNVTLLE